MQHNFRDVIYRTCIKFRGLIFRAFDWQENLWGINFHGHGGYVQLLLNLLSMLICCVLVFMDKRHTMKSTKIYTPQKIFVHWNIMEVQII